MGVSVESLTAAAQAAVEAAGRQRFRPDADKFYISRGMDSLMAEAERTAQGMRDENTSPWSTCSFAMLTRPTRPSRHCVCGLSHPQGGLPEDPCRPSAAAAA